MNRREMLQTGLAVLSAAGIEGEIQTIAPVNPQAFVLRIKGYVSSDTHARLRHEWKELWKGNPIGDLPVFILQDGATLEVIDAPEVKR